MKIVTLRCRRASRETGNTMVMTALLMTAFVGMLALVIDIGFLAGQRRFMQNGADAAALGTARLLTQMTVLSPAGSSFPIYYDVQNATAYARALDIAARNQNPNLTGASARPVFSVALDYCVAANANAGSYVYTAGCATGWKPSSTYATTALVPAGVYKVRATVHSTLNTLFAGVIGAADTTSTTAVAVATIGGVAQNNQAVGEIWPLTTEDKPLADFGAQPGRLVELWGNQTPGSFKNVLDLTPAPRWCDGTNDFTWGANQPLASNNMPSPDGTVAGYTCPSPPAATAFTAGDGSWNRSAFRPDTRPCYTGQDNLAVDVPNWLATYWRGTLATGMKVPVFKGNLGNNLNGPIRGQGNQLPTCTNTYFFQDATTIDPDHPTWGKYKDVIVFTYAPRNGGGYNNNERPECWDRPNGNGNGPNNNPFQWRSCQGNGVPDRITLVQKLTFRVYEGPLPNGICAGVNSSQSASSICGRFIAPASSPNTPTTGGPNVYGNVVRMGE